MQLRFGSIVLVTALMSLPILGQSNISLLCPLGLPIQVGSGMALNMGGAATAVADDNHTLLANPANLGNLEKTSFSATFSTDYTRIRQDKLYTDHVSSFPRQISFAFPLGIVGAAAFSITKETNATMKYESDTTAVGNGISGRIAYDRVGGVNGWQVGWGISILKKVQIGIGYKRLYLSENATKLLDIVTFDNSGTRDSVSFTFRGNEMRIGSMIPLGKAILGLSLDYPIVDNIDFTRAIYRNSDNSIVDSSYTTSRPSFQMPPVVTAGASYSVTPEWLAALDVSWTLWNRFVGPLWLSSTPIREIATTFGIGTQVIPAPNLLAPRYFETMRYRLGLRLSQLPAQGASELSATLGVGLPLRGSGGIFDCMIQFGRRSSDQYKNYSENTVSLILGFNGGRKWIHTSENTNY
jgi:long-subunit fatty acid transport protein